MGKNFWSTPNIFPSLILNVNIHLTTEQNNDDKLGLPGEGVCVCVCVCVSVSVSVSVGVGVCVFTSLLCVRVYL